MDEKNDIFRNPVEKTVLAMTNLDWRGILLQNRIHVTPTHDDRILRKEPSSWMKEKSGLRASEYYFFDDKAIVGIKKTYLYILSKISITGRIIISFHSTNRSASSQRRSWTRSRTFCKIQELKMGKNRLITASQSEGRVEKFQTASILR